MRLIYNIITKFQKYRGTLQFHLIALIVLTVSIVSTTGMLLDYRREYNQHISLIIASLEEQAQAIRIARLKIKEVSEFGRYVDDLCAQMNDSVSPGHHILVLDDTGAVTIRAQHHSGIEVERALLSANLKNSIISLGEHRLAQVRLKDKDGTTIILAQYLDHVEHILKAQLLSRAVISTATALAIISLIYLVINLLVIKSVTNLAAAAKLWAKRNFSIRSTPTGSAEFCLLAEEFNSMADQLEQHELSYLAELEQARRIQNNLLPVSHPTIAGLSVAADYCPARKVAGDLYDIFTLSENRTAIVILDVCGHGISAALLTGVVKMSLHRRLAEKEDIEEAMRLVNADLLDCTPDGLFVTACVCVWDQYNGSWTYCAAGHPGGLLLSQNRIQELVSTAPLLGVFSEAEWSSNTVNLSQGDRIFLYTDGVADAGITRDKNGPCNLGKILLNHGDMCLTKQVEALMSETVRHSNEEIIDDATILAVEVLPKPAL